MSYTGNMNLYKHSQFTHRLINFNDLTNLKLMLNLIVAKQTLQINILKKIYKFHRKSQNLLLPKVRKSRHSEVNSNHPPLFR